MSRIGSSMITTPVATMVTKERGGSSRKERFGWQNGDARNAPRDGAVVGGKDGRHESIDPVAVEARLADKVATWVPYVASAEDVHGVKAKTTNGSGGPLADVLTGQERKGYSRPIMAETGRPVRLVEDGDDALPTVQAIVRATPASTKPASAGKPRKGTATPARGDLGDVTVVLEDRVQTVLTTLKVSNTPKNRAAALDYLAALDAGLVKVSE